MGGNTERKAMSRRIAIIQGHPNPAQGRLCHALADAYAAGATAAGHSVRRIEVARLDFALLRTSEEFEAGTPPPDIVSAQAAIAWADHLLIVHPLWLGGMPALLKGFFEQVFRPGFAMLSGDGGWPQKLLAGRSARIVVTMGMPALIYRWYYRAHGIKALERSILRLAGIAPVRRTLIGLVGNIGREKCGGWIERMKVLGARAL